MAQAEAVSIAVPVADGLRAAHERGVTHRDIKPSDILITKQGVVKIVDCGLAHVQGAAPLTREGTQMETPAYMSPEQALGGDVDHRTDLWFLGAVLHEMLAGERPFQAPSVPATLYQLVHEPRRALERVAPAMRPGLATPKAGRDGLCHGRAGGRHAGLAQQKPAGKTGRRRHALFRRRLRRL